MRVIKGSEAMRLLKESLKCVHEPVSQGCEVLATVELEDGTVLEFVDDGIKSKAVLYTRAEV